MKKFINYINNEVLVKAARLNMTSISLKIIAGILISKFIAVYIGPYGMALVGNLRNFLSALQSLSISGLYKGVVKFISQSKNDAVKLAETLSTVFYFGFFTSTCLAFLCYYNAQAINNIIFSPYYNFTYIIETVAIVLPLYALNMFAFSIMNGFSKYKYLLLINMLSQVLGLMVTLILIYQENIDGALTAIVIMPALNLLITIVGIAFRKNLIASVKITQVSFTVLNKLSPFMIMALVSAIALPLVMITIRNYISDELGIKAAGYWTAMTRISDYYLMFFNSLMALYVLPRFSEINSKQEFRKEVVNIYKSIIPTFLVMLLIIFFSRSVLINILFTEAFRPVENLFGYQIIGDIIRLLSMVIAYQFLAKKMFLHFIILEVFLFVIMYLSSIYLIDEFGLQGAVMGHCVSYFMYFCILLLLFSSSLFGVTEEGLDNN